jgi:membrane associated rhomboid family serine protease
MLKQELLHGSPPWVTLALFTVTAAGNLLQVVHPGLVDAWERHPGALSDGEWWRFFTPLLVQSDGLAQALWNLLTLAVTGMIVERRFGGGRTLLLYLVAGLTGEVAGYAWQPLGGGNSIACAGLIGALFALSLRRDTGARVIGTVFALIWVLSLIDLDLAGATLGSAVTAVVAGALVSIVQRVRGPRRLLPFAAGAGVAGAVLLMALRNIHGPPVLAGVALAWGILVGGAPRAEC